MMKSRAFLFLLLVTGLALAACLKSREQQVVGGETNWLKLCTDQDGCGAGSCICGVCTTECSAALTCSGEFAGSCVETTSLLGASACAGAQQVPTGLCLPGCGNDAECGPGFACRDAVCVTTAIADSFRAAQEVADDTSPMLPASCTSGPLCSLDASTSDVAATDAAAIDAATIDAVTTDASSTDAGNNDASMTDAGQDAAAMLCDCSRQEVSLECVCAQSSSGCPPYEQEVANVLCPDGLGAASVEKGCGYIKVTSGGAHSVSVYSASDGGLVAALIYIDVPFGACARAVYQTAIPDLTTCDDYSSCKLCDGAQKNACL